MSVAISVSQGFDIPAGHYLMLSPYWCHRDQENFPDPETFKPVSMSYILLMEL